MWLVDLARTQWSMVGDSLVVSSVHDWLTRPYSETILYYLMCACSALLYGLSFKSRSTAWSILAAIALPIDVLLLKQAVSKIIGWEECVEIIFLQVLVTTLIWHATRHRIAQSRLSGLWQTEQVRMSHLEVAAHIGTHDVCTSLTIARGFTELLHDATTDETMRDDAALVLTELDRASTLTARLIDLLSLDAPATNGAQATNSTRADHR